VLYLSSKKILEGLRLTYKSQTATYRPFYELRYVELTKFPVDTGFQFNNASVIGALLRNMTQNPANIS